MLAEIDSFDRTKIHLGRLVTNLMGLVRAADIHDEQTRSDFYCRWVKLDMENELRTEPWAPPNSASDNNLAAGLRDIHSWVEGQLADDDGELL